MEKETRFANRNWKVWLDRDGRIDSHDIHISILMDIRDELQTLNRLLGCTNFTDIPTVLLGIRRNTAKKRRKNAAQ